jgi:hypothetical protein
MTTSRNLMRLALLAALAAGALWSLLSGAGAGAASRGRRPGPPRNRAPSPGNPRLAARCRSERFVEQILPTSIVNEDRAGQLSAGLDPGQSLYRKMRNPGRAEISNRKPKRKLM